MKGARLSAVLFSVLRLTSPRVLVSLTLRREYLHRMSFVPPSRRNSRGAEGSCEEANTASQVRADKSE